MTAIFTHVVGRRDGLRHIIATTGPDAFPRALCEAQVRLIDDPLALRCGDCRAKALAEAAVALETLGLSDIAARVARHASDVSFETKKAQTDADMAPGEWAEIRRLAR